MLGFLSMFLIFGLIWFGAGLVTLLILGFSPFRAFQSGLVMFIAMGVWVATLILPDARKTRLFSGEPLGEDERGLGLAGIGLVAFPFTLVLCAVGARIGITIVQLFQ